MKAAFEYSLREDVSLCGFLGDDCITMKHTPEIQVLLTAEQCLALELSLSFSKWEVWDRRMQHTSARRANVLRWKGIQSSPCDTQLLPMLSGA